LEQEGFEHAVSDLKDVSTQVESPHVLNCLGYAHLRQAFFPAAADYYSRAAELTEGKEKAQLLLNMAYATYRRSVYSSSVRVLAQAIECDPQLQSAYHLRAWLGINRSSRDVTTPAQAVRDIESALKLGPASWVLELHAAHVYDIDAKSSNRDHRQAIKDHLMKAARKGAQPRALQAPWIVDWIEPTELLAVRAQHEDGGFHRLEETYHVPPDIPSIVARLSHKEI
jgi:tetratricopeptide (TPR) repeat protein